MIKQELDMFGFVSTRIKSWASAKSIGDLLLYGFIIRLVAVVYSIVHDRYVDHIKYTDVDYHVFTNGSSTILSGQNPYIDSEYRYSPVVALLFVPNVLLNEHFGKLILIIADICSVHLHYRINIYQGTNRLNSKIFQILWLFNPLTIAISSRGSFEPILALVVLASLYLLIENQYLLAGLLYGLSIHLKLYPIIYALSIYIYLTQRKPYMKTQPKIHYWFKTLSPGINHFKFYLATSFSLILSSYISYKYYGDSYLEQSLFYHLKRKDLQHNFSLYFYLFKLFPNHQDHLSIAAFISQFLGVLTISVVFASFDTNRRTKLRKFTFSLFSSTFIFVSLNKVCTSQYFTWYLIFLPLILDSVKLGTTQAYTIASAWILSQANWLYFAYLYEYQHYDVLTHVGNCSVLFLMSNLWIIGTLCTSFDATSKRQSRGDVKED